MVDADQLVASVQEVVRLVGILTEELDGARAQRPETPAQEAKRRDPDQEPDTKVRQYVDPKRAPVDIDLLSFIGPGTTEPTHGEDQVGPLPARAVLYSWAVAFGMRPVDRMPPLQTIGRALVHILPLAADQDHDGLEAFSEELSGLQRMARAYAGEPVYVNTEQAAELLAVTDRTARRYAAQREWINYGSPGRPLWDVGDVLRPTP